MVLLTGGASAVPGTSRANTTTATKPLCSSSVSLLLGRVFGERPRLCMVLITALVINCMVSYANDTKKKIKKSVLRQLFQIKDLIS